MASIDFLKSGFLAEISPHSSLVAFKAGFQNFVGEWTQLGAAGDQTLQRRRIEHVIACIDPGVGVGGRIGQDRLIALRQRVPLLDIGEGVNHGAAFPEARIVVVLRDLGEAELLVVIGADPLGGVDGALFQRRIDVAAGELLRHHADLLQAPGRRCRRCGI